MRRLGGQDAAFLYLESERAHLHLTALYVYEQPKAPRRPLRFAQLSRHIGSRLERSQLLRQKILRPPLNLDYPYWVDDPAFALDRHVLLHEGPAPRNRRALFDIVAALHEQPLDLDRPPWEMHVIEKLGQIRGLPPNCFAIVAKYHHAAIDGASGTQLVEALHDPHPGPPADQESAPLPEHHAPGMLELLVRASINNAGTHYKLAKVLAATAPRMLQSMLQARTRNEDGEETAAGGVPATRFNGPVSAGRVFCAIELDASKIKAIRSANPGVTVNDVFLSICGGGLRQFLEGEKELPASSLVAMVPVNARAPGQRTLTGNQLSQFYLQLHTNLPGSLERLRAIHQATSKAKSGTSGFGAPEVSEISRHIPALPLAAASWLVTSLGLGYRLGAVCNCTITNVPPQHTTLYLGPCRLVYSVGSAPLIDGMGLIISVFSYEGRFNMSFTSCPDMLPDPELLAAHCREALDDLYRESLETTRLAKPAR